jgi:peptide chain release factor 1
MFEQLKVLANRLDELNILLADPAVIADQGRYLRLVQEHADLEPVVHDYQEWSGLGDAIEQHRRLLTESDDQEFRELVRDELTQLDTRMRELEERLNEAVSPKDPNDARNVVMEIRAGAGGEEAALFAAVLYRMYSLYADSRGWHVQMVDVHETEIGVSRKRFSWLKAGGPIRGCVSKAVCIAYSAFRSRSQAAASIHRP